MTMTPAPISVERLREVVAIVNGPLLSCKANDHAAWEAVSFLQDQGLALLHQLAEREAEVERLRIELEVSNTACGEYASQAMQASFRAQEAERAREEATGLLREALMGWDDLIEEMELNGMHDDPRFGYRKHKEWIGAVEAKASAAFLAASGGSK